MTESETITVPLDAFAELVQACRGTLRCANDGWEDGDEFGAKYALGKVPVHLLDQADAWLGRPQSERHNT